MTSGKLHAHAYELLAQPTRPGLGNAHKQRPPRCPCCGGDHAADWALMHATCELANQGFKGEELSPITQLWRHANALPETPMSLRLKLFEIVSAEPVPPDLAALASEAAEHITKLVDIGRKLVAIGQPWRSP